MLVGQNVIHPKFGQGSIEAQDEGFLFIRFGDAVKRFQYPLVFSLGLVLEDASLMPMVLEAAEKDRTHTAERKRRETRFYRDKAAAIRRENPLQPAQAALRKKQAANVAFKCSFCDGGTGFAAPCSAAVQAFHVSKKRQPCTQGDCSRCPESGLRSSWSMQAGADKHTGAPRRIMQVLPHKLCVLTTLEPEMREADRYIFAMYAIDEENARSGQEIGRIAAGPEMPRLWLPIEAARQLKFWEIYETQSARPAWGSGSFRYLTDASAAAVVQKANELAKGASWQQEAEVFAAAFAKLPAKH